MKILATVTKGLEDISAEEIKEIGGQNLEVSQKYINFEIDDLQKCSTLTTVDDVFIKIKKTTYYNEFVNDLEDPVKEAVVKINEIRKPGKKVSVTVSVYKNAKVDKKLIEGFMHEVVKDLLGLEVSREDESDYNLRVIIEETNLFVGLRVFKRALKDRDYAVRQMFLGSLRPTIAASIIRMVSGNLKELDLVDNFCGSGTFLAEGILFGHKVKGGDINPTAVNTAITTLSTKFGVKDPEIKAQDALQTEWEDNSFDIAVSNYPWDSQIKVESITDLYEGSVKEYARILKEKSALGFILTKPDLMVKFLKDYFPNHKVESRQIGYLGQTPYIVIASNLS